MITVILKDLIYCVQSNQADIINMEQELPTIIYILKQIYKRNDEIISSDVNTRRSVRARWRLISKSSSKFCIDQVEWYYSVDGTNWILEGADQITKSRASNNIIESILNVDTHKKIFSFTFHTY